MSSWNTELESPVSAARLFKAAVLDWHNLGPQIMPEVIASAAVIEGEGAAVGSVRQLNFTPALPFSFVKERLDYLDFDKFEWKTTLVEVGPIAESYPSGTKVASETANKTFNEKFEPTSSGGCVYKVVVTPTTTIGAEEERVQALAKKTQIGQFKAVEAYLLANPTAYA